jgi:hypothetical protein
MLLAWENQGWRVRTGMWHTWKKWEILNGILVEKPGRNIYFKEVGWDDVDWIELIPDMDQWQSLMEK